MTLITIHTVKRLRFNSGLVVVFKYYFNCLASPVSALARRKQGGTEEIGAEWVNCRGSLDNEKKQFPHTLCINPGIGNFLYSTGFISNRELYKHHGYLAFPAAPG